jgi:hypothetical protein
MSMVPIKPEQRDHLLEDATAVWSEGILLARSGLKIDPTAYLKLFQAKAVVERTGPGNNNF